MPDDGSSSPRFPAPRTPPDPYRDAPPKTFSAPVQAHVTLTRAEEPPPLDHLTEREIDEAGFLTSEKRTARDAALAEERAAAIQTTIVWTLGVVAFEGAGILVAFSLPEGWLQTVTLSIVVAVGSLAARAIVRRWRTESVRLD